MFLRKPQSAVDHHGRGTCRVVLGLALLAVPGCRQTLEVKVERLKVAEKYSTMSNQSQSTREKARETLKTSGVALETARGEIQKARMALNAMTAGERKPPADVDDALRSYEKRVETGALHNSELLALLGSAAGDAETGKVLEQALAHSTEVEILLTAIQTSQVFPRAASASASAPAAPSFDAPKSEQAIERVRGLVAQLSSKGFGGFQSGQVYELSHSDPAYEEVLKSEPDGRPVTLAKAYVTGDSTIIFVQETPTYVRVFSTDMDNEKLAQNVLLIMDKALQAAVRAKALLPIP